MFGIVGCGYELTCGDNSRLFMHECNKNLALERYTLLYVVYIQYIFVKSLTAENKAQFLAKQFHISI